LKRLKKGFFGKKGSLNLENNYERRNQRLKEWWKRKSLSKKEIPENMETKGSALIDLD